MQDNRRENIEIRSQDAWPFGEILRKNRPYVPEAACWRFQKRDGPGWRKNIGKCYNPHSLCFRRNETRAVLFRFRMEWNYNYNTRAHPLMMEKAVGA